ncbi:zinc finger, CCHC-type containing protein [Tanacetum coccineum]
MLRALLCEKGLPMKAETPQVMMIKGGKIQKANKKSLNAKGKNKVKGKGKDKKDYIPKPKNPKPTAMERPVKDDACHHCKEVGHWKRNCHVYLVELQKKRKQVGSASSSGCEALVKRDYALTNSNIESLSVSSEDTQRKRWDTISTSHLKTQRFVVGKVDYEETFHLSADIGYLVFSYLLAALHMIDEICANYGCCKTAFLIWLPRAMKHLRYGALAT